MLSLHFDYIFQQYFYSKMIGTFQEDLLLYLQEAILRSTYHLYLFFFFRTMR